MNIFEKKVCVLAFLLCMPVCGGECRAAVMTLQFKSDQGDPVGDGKTMNLTYDTAQGSSISVHGIRRIGGVPSRIYFDADEAVSAPVEDTWTTPSFDTDEIPAPLNPGFYGQAMRTPFQSPGRPGFSIGFAHTGCNTITGNFTVVEIKYNATELLSFSATFEQHCNGIVPALRGRLRYDAVAVPDITVQSFSGAALASGATADFGPVPFDGTGTSKVITILSTGTRDLTDLSAALDAAGNPEDFAVTLPFTTLPHDTSTGLQVTFTPSATGPRTATLRITSNDPDENPFVVQLAASTGTTLDIWRYNHFASVQNSGPAADLADPDNDGLVNLLEFATGSAPLAPSPPAGMLELAGEFLAFTYTRSVAATAEVQFVREVSDSPAGPWSQSGGTAETILTDDGVFQTVRVLAPAASTAGTRFVRLRVTRL